MCSSALVNVQGGRRGRTGLGFPPHKVQTIVTGPPTHSIGRPVLFLTTVIHNTAQNSCDNLPSYPADKHQSSDAVYWRGGTVGCEWSHVSQKSR